MEDNPLESRISIHPNPANHLININTNEKIDSISVYDISGKVVIDGFDSLKQIDISNLRSGIYFLKMSLNDSLITKKIIVE
ncbi:MAG: T9SS type A sorting domain-containing protein [Tamlana sp.]